MASVLVYTQIAHMFPLRSSLFPHVPPYLHHLPAGGGYDPPLPQELGQAAWAAPSGISPIVEESVKGGGFTLIQVGLRQWQGRTRDKRDY